MPKPGSVVICNYDSGFRAPEMVKTRLAVVISPRLPYRDGLCTLVPLSTTPPSRALRYQCKITLPISPPPPFEGQEKWVKADMIATLSLNRMELPYTARDKITGKRKFVKIQLDNDQLTEIYRAVLHAVGLDRLTPHV